MIYGRSLFNVDPHLEQDRYVCSCLLSWAEVLDVIRYVLPAVLFETSLGLSSVSRTVADYAVCVFMLMRVNQCLSVMPIPS